MVRFSPLFRLYLFGTWSRRYGEHPWNLVEIRNLLSTAARVKRISGLGRASRGNIETTFTARFGSGVLLRRLCLSGGSSNQGNQDWVSLLGKNRCPALFCSLGASICATDLFPDVAKQRGWVESNQHASSAACPINCVSGRCA